MTAHSPGITAVLLSWKRVGNLDAIVSKLRLCEQVKEIIVWNNNPDVRLVNRSLTVINSARNFRPYARYACAMLASQQMILFQDDDIIVPSERIIRAYSACLKDPHCIHGGRGRNLVEGRYTTMDIYGPCDIILGQFMLFSKALLAAVYGDLLRLAPIERGDDIAFSLLCGVKHRAHRMNMERIDSDPATDLWREPGHKENRQEMVDRVLDLKRRRD